MSNLITLIDRNFFQSTLQELFSRIRPHSRYLYFIHISSSILNPLCKSNMPTFFQKFLFWDCFDSLKNPLIDQQLIINRESRSIIWSEMESQFSIIRHIKLSSMFNLEIIMNRHVYSNWIEINHFWVFNKPKSFFWSRFSFLPLINFLFPSNIIIRFFINHRFFYHWWWFKKLSLYSWSRYLNFKWIFTSTLKHFSKGKMNTLF